jgi:hypothetical protein
MSLGAKNFWLRVYQLDQALNACGASDEERIGALMEEVSAMPPELQSQALQRLKRLTQLAGALLTASDER